MDKVKHYIPNLSLPFLPLIPPFAFPSYLPQTPQKWFYAQLFNKAHLDTQILHKATKGFKDNTVMIPNSTFKGKNDPFLLNFPKAPPFGK